MPAEYDIRFGLAFFPYFCYEAAMPRTMLYLCWYQNNLAGNMTNLLNWPRAGYRSLRILSIQQNSPYAISLKIANMGTSGWREIRKSWQDHISLNFFAKVFTIILKQGVETTNRCTLILPLLLLTAGVSQTRQFTEQTSLKALLPACRRVEKYCIKLICRAARSGVHDVGEIFFSKTMHVLPRTRL